MNDTPPTNPNPAPPPTPGLPAAAPDSAWYVLHLRPRSEKRVAEHCNHWQLPFYLPLRRETKVYQRRRVTVDKPVFPGYLFTAFDAHGRAELLKTNHLVRILEVANQPELLHQLDQVRRALTADPALGSCGAIQRGTPVRITAGPFMGLEGRVDTIRGLTRVVLNVTMIGQGVAVVVDRAMLALLN